MNSNDVATLRTVAMKLKEMGDELKASGVIGYGLSINAMSETVTQVIENIESE